MQTSISHVTFNEPMAEVNERDDVFISHASEDKDVFVRPLAQALVNLGLKVWYDEFSLQIGDNLRESIDKGLSNSNYGLIILSKNFFSKNWTKMELEGLIALYMKNKTRILPVWHGVNSEDVIRFSPMIATIFALSSSLGVENIAAKINRVAVGGPAEPYTTVQSESPFSFDEIDPTSVREMQNKRFRFLLRLYETRDPQQIKNDQYEVGEELGYSREVVDEVTKYLADKGYIEYPIIGSFVRITYYGMDYIESLIPDSALVRNARTGRLSILKELYANKGMGINMWDLKNKLKIPDDATMLDLVFYLNYAGLISPRWPFITITTEGIDFVEGYSF